LDCGIVPAHFGQANRIGSLQKRGIGLGSSLMPKAELEDRWALVTGGGTRLGAVISKELARAGCHVLVHYRTHDKGAREVADEIRLTGRNAKSFKADLTCSEQLHALAQWTKETTEGLLGVLVHNAANFERVEPKDLTQEYWDRALALNAGAPYRLTLALSDALAAARGSVIAMACVSALKPWKNYVPYATSKAALFHTVKGLALAMAPDVRVNAVAPGAVLLPEHYDTSKQARLLNRIALQRFGEPGDIARAVRFLAENDYITGQMIVVDGGLALA
ncbi:MAG TPA: SDR family oxidoreductase, partial [Polyangiaceae bacterium]|nr:SDR family oxidoreductase [Polyangiaceae bacterium]